MADSEIEQRVRSLENWRNEQKTVLAVGAERRKHMDTRFGQLEGRLDKIDGHVSKLVWMVFGLIIASVLGFLLSGGVALVNG